MKRLASSLFLFACVAACGGRVDLESSSTASGASTSVKGSVAGVSLANPFALAVQTTQAGDSPRSTLAIALASRTFDCSSSGLSNATELLLSVADGGAGGVPPGTYPVDPSKAGPLDPQAVLFTTNDICLREYPSHVSGGSITLATVSTSHVSGTFQLVFQDGDELAGGFDADICASGTTTSSLGCD
jgi:hypothetical protein